MWFLIKFLCNIMTSICGLSTISKNNAWNLVYHDELTGNFERYNGNFDVKSEADTT